MNIILIFFIAISLSMDAFSLSLAYGTINLTKKEITKLRVWKRYGVLGIRAVDFAKKVDDFGVKVILPTSKAGDGAKTGYDLPVIRAMARSCSAKIVASGGAGKMEHFIEAAEAGAQVLLAASVFHFKMIEIPELKAELKRHGFIVK